MRRRQFLIQGFSSAMSLRLFSVASGLPLNFLLTGSTQAAINSSAKYTILAVSSWGEPLNVIAPGTFPIGSSDPVTSKFTRYSPSLNNASQVVNGTTISLKDLVVKGTNQYGASGLYAAKALDYLPTDLKNHITYAYFDTKTVDHPAFSVILRGAESLRNMYGEVDELSSVIAQENAAALGTLNADPISLSVQLKSNGAVIAPTNTDAIIKAFNPAYSIQGLTAENFKNIYTGFFDDYYKNVYTKELSLKQKKCMDNQVNTLDQSITIGTELVNLLNSQERNSITTALALCSLAITPCVVIQHDWGGDNHTDSDGGEETGASLRAIKKLDLLNQLLNNHPVFSVLKDKLCFASLDVFGRTPSLNDGPGRDHYGEFTCGMIYGNHLKGTVLGGPVLQNDKVVSGAYDPNTGIVTNTGRITRDNSLSSYVKTVLFAAGIPENICNERVKEGYIAKAIST